MEKLERQHRQFQRICDHIDEEVQRRYYDSLIDGVKVWDVELLEAGIAL